MTEIFNISNLQRTRIELTPDTYKAEKTLNNEAEFYAGENYQKIINHSSRNTNTVAAFIMRQQKVSAEAFQQKYFTCDYEANQKMKLQNLQR